MRTICSATVSALCLGLLLGACGSGGSSRHLAAVSSTSAPTMPTETTAPGAAPAARTVATGSPTTRATAVTAASARTTVQPTMVPRATTTTAAPQPTTTAAAQGYTFHEHDYAFTPATFSVAHGTRVTIVNDGPSTHTWTSDSGLWDSGSLASGYSYSYTFPTPGTFSFKCTIHPVMQGSVTVT